MENNQLARMLIYLLGVMLLILLGLIFTWVILKIKLKRQKASAPKENKQKTTSEKKKSKINEVYNVQSVFDFMDFDKIEDNMIIQKNGKRFLMVVKCQGINYDLMSGVEKASVEQGFIQYLNTLRNPIQIYVQTRTVDLTGSINTYKEKIRKLGDNLNKKEFEYNQKMHTGNYDKYELERDNFEIVKARNLYEYAIDVVNNTEKMSLNKNILSKQYYIITSYYPEDVDNYSQEEINNLAFSELYTRSQSTISLLSVCGISSKILDSMELADLLYAAYNRDEAETYDLAKAVNSGYDNIYSTAPDVLDRRMKELDLQIEKEAVEKANDVIFKVKNEQEKERKLRQKEEQYDDILHELARQIIQENRDILGDETTDMAVEELDERKKQDDEKKAKKESSRKKGELTNEQKKTTTRRAGRPRKTA